ncbi:putative wall-associated receptor kinase-like 16 [Rutidosis leptorrhynchoides]|uniref:putative wall-associated receptor kinase-like 16 n=1 Tax=Rutidosis leptorrhynchoides TaxID=125765 RepID=UPI003A98FE7E
MYVNKKSDEPIVFSSRYTYQHTHLTYACKDQSSHSEVNDMETATPRLGLATWASCITAKARFLPVLYANPFRALVPSMQSCSICLLHNVECKNPGADRPFKAIVGILATGVGTYASALASVAWKLRIRKINFRKNGGKLLKHPRVRIFTEAELAKATNNYDESKKLGEGGFGSVYKGRIAVGESGFGSANKGRIIEVAIKKPKDVHKPLMKKGFQDQLKTVILKNHENVVKLYGICLETRIPLLVYEYILNDTLFKHIHPKASAILRSWKNRLRIATEAALALKEMHSSKIIHGNIKSANILLDHNYLVKISDFGTSQLMSPEHSHIVAAEKEGTLGYIDPEYLTTGKLTIESDVYSFGVVLMELLTEKKPISSDTNEFGEPINIISHFISSVKNGTLSDVVNFEAASEEEIKQVETVAEIAAKCLDQSRRKRPTMSEVAQQLAPINQSLTVAGNIEVDGTIDASAEILVTTEASEHAMSSCLSWLDLASSCI